MIVATLSLILKKMLRITTVSACMCLSLATVVDNENNFEYFLPEAETDGQYDFEGLGLEKGTRPRPFVNTDSDYMSRPLQRNRWDLSQTFFPSLESYEWQANATTVDKYPWIAKVVHSRTQNYPYMCTASCIQKRLFITAARCLVFLKVPITTVHYQKYKFNVKALALPDAPSKQMFDDIGIVIVHENKAYKGKWPTVAYHSVKRDDNRFEWFAKLGYTEKTIIHKAIGYVQQKYLERLRVPQKEVFNLKELDVIVDINACSAILSRGVITGFFVPCYHSCNTTQHKKKDPLCSKYLGTEGAAVYNVKTKKLLGVATWGCGMVATELPVGFTVPNSVSFFENLECAQKILKDNQYNDRKPPRGYHQTLCIPNRPV